MTGSPALRSCDPRAPSLIGVSSSVLPPLPGQTAKPRVNPNAAVIADFHEAGRRLRGAAQEAGRHAAEAARSRPRPQQIDAHERALGKLMQEARTAAKPGRPPDPGDAAGRPDVLRPIFSRAGGRADQERDPGQGIQGRREARGERALSRRSAALDHAAAGPRRAARSCPRSSNTASSRTA